MSEKSKSSLLSKPYVFLIFWAAANIIGFASPEIIDRIAPFFGSNPMYWSLWWLISSHILAIGVVTAAIQTFVLRLHFRQEFKGWLFWSLLGWLVTTIWYLCYIFFSTAYNNFASTFGILDAFIAMFLILLPPSLAQTWVLRKYVKHNWLWLISTLLGSAIYGLLIKLQLAQWGMLSYSLITGLAILSIFAKYDMRKTIFASDNNRVRAENEQSKHLTDGDINENPVLGIESRQQQMSGD